MKRRHFKIVVACTKKKKKVFSKSIFADSDHVCYKLQSLPFAPVIKLHVPIWLNPMDLSFPVMFWELSPVVAPILYITDNYFLCDCLFIACPLGTTLQEVPDDMGSKGLSK